MQIPDKFKRPLLSTVDFCYSVPPQPVPSKTKLAQSKIVSHRGEHDNRTVMENTFAAFDPLVERGVWGLECDIRWTADFVPVVFHDEHMGRLFGRGDKLGLLTAKQLRKHYPRVPFLEELLRRYEGKIHFMLELKEEHYGRASFQSQVLQQLFSGFSPARDFHFISLQPKMFQYVDFLPRQSLLTVAEENVGEISQQTMENGLGGITGHFLLLNQKLHRSHLAKGQRMGTGFIKSKSCFYRELNRGVEWIFSNHALKLQSFVD